MEKIVLIYSFLSFLMGAVFYSILIFFKNRNIKRWSSYGKNIKGLIFFITYLKQRELKSTREGFGFDNPIPFLESLSGERYFSFKSILDANYKHKDRFFYGKINKEPSLQELLGKGNLSSSHYLNKEDILLKLYEIYYKYERERF